jgi:hypothetical protein
MHINLDTPNGMAKAIVYGDLEFDQAAPILIDSIARDLYFENPLDVEMYEKHGLNGILEFYEARNDKLRYDYSYWIQPVGSPHKTQLQIDVHVPLA